MASPNPSVRNIPWQSVPPNGHHRVTPGRPTGRAFRTHPRPVPALIALDSPNHGKLAPLKRLSPGDSLIFYSPKTAYPDGATLKTFTALGTVRDAPPYQWEMRPGMLGYRRDIDWMKATETAISSLSERLEFTRGNWGMLARRGLFEISDADARTIRAAMLQEEHDDPVDRPLLHR
ncbi:EVE domain-containing protein [Paracoccus halophilus]|uniref:EVE domain-containing protein n=1 Tax=Paracoccus halophilus TaxID=376733 RepID=A0A1I0SQ82_9RHOB|nr:EVE domain-containing protein [Paracoccus halophilus]SFA41684.1 EVE domain-containing protein [Paracoccus halophilus]